MLLITIIGNMRKNTWSSWRELDLIEGIINSRRLIIGIDI